MLNRILLFRENHKIIAALCAMVAVFFFSLNDAFIKFLSGDYALHQIVLVRSGIGLLILMAIFIPFHGTLSVLKTRRLGMHLLRGLAVVFANLTFLQHMVPCILIANFLHSQKIRNDNFVCRLLAFCILL